MISFVSVMSARPPTFVALVIQKVLNRKRCLNLTRQLLIRIYQAMHKAFNYLKKVLFQYLNYKGKVKKYYFSPTRVLAELLTVGSIE